MLVSAKDFRIAQSALKEKSRVYLVVVTVDVKNEVVDEQSDLVIVEP